MKSLNATALAVDAYEHLFMNWLLSNDYLLPYRKNLRKTYGPHLRVRSHVHDLLTHILTKRNMSPLYLIQMSFRFDTALEGCDFWLGVNAQWKKFFSTYF